MGCIDIASGTTMFNATDFDLPGFIPLEFERSYQSSSKLNGPLGHKWTHSLNIQMLITHGGLVYQDHEGRQIAFDLPDEGGDVYNSQDGLTLKRRLGEYYLLTRDLRQLVFRSSKDRSSLLHLVRIEDLNDNAIHFSYSHGLLHIITDTVSRELHFSYDMTGRLTEIRLFSRDIAAEGMIMARYEYDEAGDLTAVYDRPGTPYTYEYQQHLMTKYTNRNKYSCYYLYDEKGHCVRTWKDGGSMYRELNYDDKRRTTRVMNSLGFITVYEFNEAGLVIRETDPSGNSIQSLYNDDFDLLLMTNDSGNVIAPVLTFDNNKNPVEEVDGEGGAVKYHYNALNLLIQREDADGTVWKWEYDNKGNLARFLPPHGKPWVFEHDDRGFLVKTIQPNGRMLLQTRTHDLRTITLSDEFGLIVRNEYDALGNPVALTDGEGQRQILSYDAAGYLIGLEHPDNGVEIWRYDNEGNPIYYRSQKGAEFRMEYDGWALCTSRTYPGGKQVRYVYDSEEWLAEVINEKGERHLFTADALGRVKQQTYFDGRMENYEYDSRGNITALISGGKKVSMEYDGNSNLIRKLYSDGSELILDYDVMGRTVRAESGGSVVEYSYDALSNIVSESQDGIVLRYDYDVSGNRTAMFMGGKCKRTYEHDSRNRLIRIDDSRNGTHLFTYDVLDRTLTHTMPPGIEKRWTHGKWNRTRDELIQRADGTVLLQRGMEYDTEGQLIKISDRDGGETQFHYNQIGSLEKVIKNGQVTEQYLHDECRNLSHMPSTGSQYFGAGNRLLQTGEIHCHYDTDGNISVMQRNTQKTAFRYNEEGQLIEMVLPEGDVCKYEYDPTGRRTKKKLHGTDTEFVWDHESLFIEAQNNSPVIEYLFLPETFFPLAQTNDNTTYFYNTDNMGVPTEVFDSSGEIIWRGDFTAYGKSAGGYGKSITPFRFLGQYHDRESGLHYNWCRYYDPNIGRYISSDPIGIYGGMNAYQYTLNPLNWADPYGLSGKISWLPPYMERARARGVSRAWARERDLLRSGLPGSRNWTPSEAKIIKSGSAPPGWEGHHKKSVRHYYGKCKEINNACKKKQKELRQKCKEEAKRLAESPENIQMLRNGQARSGRSGMQETNEHLAAHRGNFCNASHGRFNV